MKRQWLRVLCLAVLCLSAVAARADLEATYFVQGGTLAGSPEYSWWYGCSPTAAGMMMGYYDAKGYSNLVPGVAEASTFPKTDGIWEYNAQYAIASPDHVEAYYGKGYLGKNDDLARPTSSFNCLADFMGTSQDSVGNVNGSTGFWSWNDGSRMYNDDIEGLGYSYWNSDGMYGIGEYVEYADADYSVASLYTQRTDNLGLTYGFTFDDYQAEIDAGRVVMIHVTGHSMFGYGYDDVAGTITVGDTWTEGLHTMAWGGSYSGLTMWGVTVLELSPVPVPAAILLGMLGMGVAGLKLRKFV